jgi:uncharacterized protein YdaU (DUF1376 family)
MTNQSPAFQFYPSDWLADANVAMMSVAGRGVYITLLCYCWREGSLPADGPKLARLCGITADEFADLWPDVKPCFLRDGDRLRHKRLDCERDKQEEWRLKSSRGGKKSAENRAQGSSKGGARVVEPPYQPKSNTSSSSSSSSSKKKKKAAMPPLPASLNTQAFKGKWQEWLDYRRTTRRNPVSPEAAKRQFNALGKVGADLAIATIEQSIANDWTGLFPEKLGPKGIVNSAETFGMEAAASSGAWVDGTYVSNDTRKPHD